MGFLDLSDRPNVIRMENRRNIAGLIKALGYEKDYKIRRSAAEALGRVGNAETVEPLIAALKDRSLEVRKGAAWALGEIGDPRAIESLGILLGRYHGSGISKALVLALAKFGDARVVEPLITTFKKGSDSACYLAVVALGDIGDVRAVDSLIAELKRCDTDEFKNHWHIIDVVPYDAEKAYKGGIIEALDKMGDIRAIVPLIAVIKDPRTPADEHAVEALRHISERVPIQAVIEWERAEMRYGDTPLHTAIFHGFAEIASLLISRGANVNARLDQNSSDPGATPLHLAAKKGKDDIVTLLLKNGANVNPKLGYVRGGTSWGATPLHLAVSPRIVQLLVENGANLEAIDDSGDTPLHYAVLKGLSDKALELIRLGANVNAVDKSGDTPLSLAERHCYPVVDRLRQAGAKKYT